MYIFPRFSLDGRLVYLNLWPWCFGIKFLFRLQDRLQSVNEEPEPEEEVRTKTPSGGQNNATDSPSRSQSRNKTKTPIPRLTNSAKLTRTPAKTPETTGASTPSSKVLITQVGLTYPVLHSYKSLDLGMEKPHCEVHNVYFRQKCFNWL